MENTVTDLNRIIAQLDEKRREETADWHEISQLLAPHMGIFDEDYDATKKRHLNFRKLTNSETIDYVNTLAAGMMSGISNQSTRWFRFIISDTDSAEGLQRYNKYTADVWLDKLRKAQEDIFNRSNLYNCLIRFYQELAVFGTAAFSIEEDEETGLYFRFYTIGSYSLGVNKKGKVDKFAHVLVLNAPQMAEYFGADCLPEVKQALQSKSLTRTWNVNHLIYPNSDFKPDGDNRHMAFASTYFCNDKILRRSGFEEFPMIVTRWFTRSAESIYGVGLGHLTLGDLRQLQKQEQDTLKGSDRIIRSPLNVPDDITDVDLTPDGVNYYSPNKSPKGITPIYSATGINMQIITGMADRTLKRISKNLYTDTFLMLAQRDKNMTATEVAELQSERMQMLGPTYNIIKTDGLDALFSRALAIEFRTGQLPDPPEDLGGSVLKVEYQSILAQAQKAQELSILQQALNYISAVAKLQQGVAQLELADNIDFDRMLKDGLKALGAPADILKSEEARDAIRQARAEAQQQQVQQAQQSAQIDNINRLAQGAKALGQTPASGDNALASLIGTNNQ